MYRLLRLFLKPGTVSCIGEIVPTAPCICLTVKYIALSMQSEMFKEAISGKFNSFVLMRSPIKRSRFLIDRGRTNC